MKCCESVVLGSGKRVFLLLVADAPRLCPGRYVRRAWVNRQLRPVRGPSYAGLGGEPGIVAATVRAYIVCGTERGPLFR